VRYKHRRELTFGDAAAMCCTPAMACGVHGTYGGCNEPYTTPILPNPSWAGALSGPEGPASCPPQPEHAHRDRQRLCEKINNIADAFAVKTIRRAFQ
jgi:hypothetical protein